MRRGVGDPSELDHLVVAHRYHRPVRVHQQVAGEWRSRTIGPGGVSLLSGEVESRWRWEDPADAVCLHLSHEGLVATGRRMYGRDVEGIDVHDVLAADDPALHRTAMLIAQEGTAGGEGTSLMVDTLTTQLGVHILRRHADVVFRNERRGLTVGQERLVREYVRAHLAESITLDDLAAAVALSRYHFLRQFREAMDMTPHEFVLRHRVARARALLQRTSVPLIEIASTCGFADQSHMTRVFRRRVGLTPGQCRAGYCPAGQ